MTSDSSVPYIGSRISLTSKSAIRYEGILYTIDTNESTVALKDVRSFGSEDRRRPGGYIAPSPEIYEYIIFRGPDIAELNVISTPAATAAARAVADDPAIVATVPKEPVRDEPLSNTVAVPPTQQQHQDSAPRVAPVSRPWGPPPSPRLPPGLAPKIPDGAVVANGNDTRPSPPRSNKPQQSRREADGLHPGNTSNSGSTTPRQRGPQPHFFDHANTRRRHRYDNYRQRPGIEIPNEDFDFEAMNEKFDKVSLSSTVNGEGGDAVEERLGKVELKYDKESSFFDNLEQGSRDRSSASERRNVDFETFGELNRPRNYGAGRGRGRGRGGNPSRFGRGGRPSRGGGRYHGGHRPNNNPGHDTQDTRAQDV